MVIDVFCVRLLFLSPPQSGQCQLVGHLVCNFKQQSRAEQSRTTNDNDSVHSLLNLIPVVHSPMSDDRVRRHDYVRAHLHLGGVAFRIHATVPPVLVVLD